MSAHLTVYSMAIAAERPLHLRAAEQARLAAAADAASGRGAKPPRERLGSARLRSWWSGITADRRTGSESVARRVIGQPAG